MPDYEPLGYLASTLVFATFWMRTMLPLRLVAIASNVAFAGYGWLVGAVLRISVILLAIYAGFMGLTYLGFQAVPVGFIPDQDKGKAPEDNDGR